MFSDALIASDCIHSKISTACVNLGVASMIVSPMAQDFLSYWKFGWLNENPKLQIGKHPLKTPQPGRGDVASQQEVVVSQRREHAGGRGNLAFLNLRGNTIDYTSNHRQ